jgi:Tfp pilus assembly protein PilO
MHLTGSRLSLRRQQMWLYVIAGLFVCDFVACGYLPSRQRLAALERASAQQRRTIALAAAQGAELPGLERRVRDMRKVVESFDVRVPADRALGTFLQQVAAIMKDYGLGEQVVLPGKEAKTDDLNCVPIHLACKGTLADVFRFFTRLQSLDRLVRIEKVALDNDPGLTGQISMQVEAAIFEQSAKHHQTYGPADASSTGGGNHDA